MKTHTHTQFPDFNFSCKYFNYQGNLIHYIDVGSGDPIILLHGNPAWSFLYRKMIPILGRTNRVIAPDLLGFGLSDKPKDISFYTFENHYLSISALLESLKLKNVVIVGQDWGGPLISYFAIKHKNLIKGIVLMNTYLPGMSFKIPLYFRVLFRSFYSRILIQDFDLLRLINFNFGFSKKISPETKAAYFYPQTKKSDRISIVAFANMIPSNDFHPTSPYFKQLKQELTRWNIPKLLLFSDNDYAFKNKSAERLSFKLPNTKFLLIKNAGHYLQEDKGEEIAQNILSYFSHLPN